jgi:hypothetical protein
MDFVVVGAPKCGTTSLHRWLTSSVQVYTPKKELHYFGRDLTFRTPRMSLATYEGHFEYAPEEAIRGEVAIWYLYSSTAAHEIRAYAPDARIIATVRNPVDFLYSMHSQAVFNNDEPERDFEKALAGEAAHAASSEHSKYAYAMHATRYRELACFGTQLQRYLSVFPTEQVHVIVLDDLATKPAEEWLRLSAFLGIPPSGVDVLGRVNPNKRRRSPLLSRAASTFGIQLVPRLAPKTPRPLKAFGRGVLQGLDRWNTVFEERPPMDAGLRSRLTEEFIPEVEKLEMILKRDLHSWKSSGR